MINYVLSFVRRYNAFLCGISMSIHWGETIYSHANSDGVFRNHCPRYSPCGFLYIELWIATFNRPLNETPKTIRCCWCTIQSKSVLKLPRLSLPLYRNIEWFYWIQAATILVGIGNDISVASCHTSWLGAFNRQSIVNMVLILHTKMLS